MNKLTTSLLAASLLLFACNMEEEYESFSPEDKADQISGHDDPSGILGRAEKRLSKLISKAELGKSFGVKYEEIPYPDTYWPMIENGIAAQWLEKDGSYCAVPNQCRSPQAAPLAKWMKIANPANMSKAIRWENKNHGSSVPDVQGWFGHCPGWVAGAMLNSPVVHPVWAKGDGRGGVVECADNEAGCVKFEIGDINALTAEVYENAVSSFIGDRCDVEPSKIKRDEYGRIIRNGSGCKGLNPGSMLILMANRLKNEGKPFAIDAQNEQNTEQIWNQPAYKYTVNRFRKLSESEAANLVATGKRHGSETDYLWNSRARGFAFVDISLHWVTETAANLKVVSGKYYSKKTRMVAVIELSHNFDNPNAQIIGGEYIDDPSVGANRLRVAPFAWVAIQKGEDSVHNPYVRGRAVQKLIDMGKAKTSPVGSDVCGGKGEPACNCGGGKYDLHCAPGCQAGSDLNCYGSCAAEDTFSCEM